MSETGKISVLVVTAPVPKEAEGAGGLVRIDGKEAMLRCIELYLKRDDVGQILLALAGENVEEVKRRHAAHLGFSGVKLVTGGPSWVDQAAEAVAKLAADATHVIVHDAARPAVPYTDIAALIEASEKSPAVALACPCRNTLVKVDAGKPLAFEPAGWYMQWLTPMAFSRERFLQIASDRAEPEAGEYTIVRGSPLNLRIAGAADASMVQSMINLLPKPKVRGPANPFEEAQW